MLITTNTTKMTKLSIKKFKLALPGSHGVQSIIAKKCEVDRSQITLFLRKHPELKELCLEEREKIIDVAENRLFKAADNGDKWAIEKIVSTIGKSRGWVESQQIEHSGNISSDSAEEMRKIWEECNANKKADTNPSNKD